MSQPGTHSKPASASSFSAAWTSGRTDATSARPWRRCSRRFSTCAEPGRIRLSSINANDVTPALIELNAHPRLCSHWHMPLQSGSDAVLRAMHRGYRRAQYLRVVRALREVTPDTQFTTDVMVAFPGESEDDHARHAVAHRRGRLPCLARLSLVTAPGHSGVGNCSRSD